MSSKSTLLLLVALAILGVIGQVVATPVQPQVNVTTATVAPLRNGTSPRTNVTTTPQPSRRRGGSTEGWFPEDRGCIYNDSTGRCLDIEQSRKSPQWAAAQMWRCNNNPVAQNFDIFRFWVPNPPSNPPYVIRSTAPASGNKYYCLDVAGGNAYEGQSVQWWECNDSPAQFWTVNYEPGGISGRISPHGRPDLCLDPRGGDGGDRDGQPMQLWRCLDNHWVQKWKVAPFGSFACKSRPNNEE